MLPALDFLAGMRKQSPFFLLSVLFLNAPKAIAQPWTPQSWTAPTALVQASNHNSDEGEANMMVMTGSSEHSQTHFPGSAHLKEMSIYDDDYGEHRPGTPPALFVCLSA